MPTLRAPAPTDPGPTQDDPPDAAPPTPSARAPRAVRPAVNARLIAVAVGIIVVCTAGAAALFATVSGTSPVVIAATALAKGQLIEAGDLTTAAVAADPTVATVPGTDLESLLGQRAAVDVPAGGLLSPGSVTTDPVPGPGQTLVGIPVTAAQAPLADLAPGTPVRLMYVPTTEQDQTDARPATPVPAVVVSAGFAPDGTRVVDVTVAASAAETVTGWAAAQNVAIAVDTVAR